MLSDSSPNNPLRNLFLFYTNCRSIVNKTLSFSYLISVYSPVIIALTETWLDEHLPTSAIELSGYNVFRKDRRGKGGGVLLGVKNCYKCSPLPDSPVDELEIVGCDVLLHSITVRIVVSYLPDGSDRGMGKKLFNKLSTLCGHKYNYISVEDFNLPLVDWDKELFQTNGNYLEFENLPAKFQLQD